MDDSKTMEQLRELQDMEAIRQLTARYNFAFDTRNAAEWVKCWTEDGYFERYNSFPRARGHAELRELANTFAVDGKHVNSDFVIKINGDTAEQECYSLYLDMKPPCTVSMFGTYRDNLVRTSEGWKFSVRIFVPHFIRPSEENAKA